MNARTGLSPDSVARAAIGCLTWFLAVVGTEHAVRSGLSPGRHQISEYAVGPGGWLMTTGFLAWAAAFALTAVALHRTPLHPPGIATLLAGLIVLCAIGAVGTALFDTGTSVGAIPAGRHLTASNHAHDTFSGGLEWSLFGAIVCSLALEDKRRFITLTLGLLVTALAFGFLFSPAALDLPGARQRALLAVGCAWHLLLLRVLCASARARAS